MTEVTENAVEKENALAAQIRTEAEERFGLARVGRLRTSFDTERGTIVALENHRGDRVLVSGFGQTREIALRDLQTNLRELSPETGVRARAAGFEGGYRTIPGIGPALANTVEVPIIPAAAVPVELRVEPVLRSQGQKDDRRKVKWTLLPLRPVQEVLEVLRWAAHEKVRPDGSLGYGENNWQLVRGARERYTNAAMRHLADYMAGKRIDEESGRHTLAHAACCVLFLLWFELTGENRALFESEAA